MKRLSVPQIVLMHSVLMVFLELNGAGLTCTDQDIVETGLRIAAGEMDDKELLEWILRNN